MLKTLLSTRGRRVTAAGALLVGGVSIGAAAMAQSSMGQSSMGQSSMANSSGWHGMHRGHRMESGAMRKLQLASRLAGLEVYLAITPEQQPQWRAFTAAALAMVPDRAPPSSGDAFAAIDQITARVESMAEPAQKLHDATAALKAALTPDQIGKMNELWATFQAEHEHGPWRHRGPDGAAPPPPAHP